MTEPLITTAGARVWPNGREANDADALLVTPGGFVRQPERKHNHYFKPVAGLSHVDVYRVLHLFNVGDPCLQHAVKKLLVAGGRGGGKDTSRDIQEAIDTLKRWQDMRAEEGAAA